VISSYFGDNEAKRLGLEMKHALELAHINAQDATGQMAPGNFVLGIVIGKASKEEDFAESLAKTLTADGGLAVAPLSPFSHTMGPTGIAIGPKPIVLAEEPAPRSKNVESRHP
jgi:hypothetical protein